MYVSNYFIKCNFIITEVLLFMSSLLSYGLKTNFPESAQLQEMNYSMVYPRDLFNTKCWCHFHRSQELSTLVYNENMAAKIPWNNH